MHDDAHITDQDLIRSLDGELPQRHKAEIEEHLAACWSCRSRRAAMERTIEQFTSGRLAEPLPPVDGPRARLKAHLAETAAQSPIPAWKRFRLAGLAAAAVLAILAAKIDWTAGTHTARYIPDRSLTPGASVVLSREQVCSGQDRVQFIPASVAGRVFAEYGIPHPPPRSYEVDYLISPELGGSDDVRNMWPQPYSPVWNAHVKDALEDRLHQLVCSGRVDLGTAQRDISTDWVAAYKKYFHSDQPLPAHRGFTKDQPWE